MVKIADKAGLPCYLKPEQLSWYRDKSACRDVLDKLGLPAPGFRKISVELLKQGSEEEIQQSIANLQYPLISKPLDKYGSRGIFIIHHSDEVRKKPCRQRNIRTVRKFWLRNTMTVMSLT